MEKDCDNCRHGNLDSLEYPCKICDGEFNMFEQEEWSPKQGELIEVKSHEYNIWEIRRFLAIDNNMAVCQTDIDKKTYIAWNLYRQIKEPIIKYQWIKSGVNGLFKAGSTATGISAYYTDEEAAKDPNAKEKIKWTRKEFNE